MVRGNHAAEAYDRFAPVYDEFNAQNDYELWLGEVLLPELEKHGLQVGRVLDVGCGTGKAFPPLLSRGWRIVGLDASKGMLDQAAAGRAVHVEDSNLDAPAIVAQADARHLPTLPGFDLILALNDVVNYLTEDGDLERFFAGVVRNLAPGGLLCFDATCLSVFESNWIAGRAAPMSERGWRWSGLSEEVAVGGTFEVELSGEGIEPHLHRQRHWTRERVEAAMEEVGFRCLAALGQREEDGRLLLEEPDESIHERTIYVGGHRG